MDNDDRQEGRILTRREVLALIGGGSLALLVGCAADSGAGQAATATPKLNAEAQSAVAQQSSPSAAASAAAEVATADAATSALPNCVVRPEVTEGPYYVDEQLVRADIRSDPGTGAVKAGAPLALTFAVSQVANGACTPLAGATVDVWHCDADGVYSDVTDAGFSTVGQKFLRGSQVTDSQGRATFTTIYPGWYAGRTVHIHFKVRPSTTTAFTSQLFFDDAFTDQVFKAAPYSAKGQRNTLNSNDGIYEQQLLLSVDKAGDGYAATFPIGIDLSTIGSGQSGGPGGPGSGGPPPGGPRPGATTAP